MVLKCYQCPRKSGSSGYLGYYEKPRFGCGPCGRRGVSIYHPTGTFFSVTGREFIFSYRMLLAIDRQPHLGLTLALAVAIVMFAYIR